MNQIFFLTELQFQSLVWLSYRIAATFAFGLPILILIWAKQVGFANCSCGCENNLLKLCDQIDFELGDDPLYET